MFVLDHLNLGKVFEEGVVGKKMHHCEWIFAPNSLGISLLNMLYIWTKTVKCLFIKKLCLKISILLFRPKINVMNDWWMNTKAYLAFNNEIYYIYLELFTEYVIT